MRTKTLLLTAALIAAGVATSMAQVYSVNAVGYVKRTAPSGFSILANPLNNGNNKVSTVLSGVPGGFTVYKFNNATTSFFVNSFDADFGWDDPDQVLAPGEAAFVLNPKAAVDIVFVGEVAQGNLTTPLPKGFSLAASKVPQAGLLQTDLKYPAAIGDTVYRYRNNGYLINSFDDFGWDEEPTVEVAEGFFVLKAATATWSRTFSVN